MSFWSSRDEIIVRGLYATTGNAEIGELVNRSARNVGQKARKMGLAKSPEFLRTAGKFQCGHATWNKGVAFNSVGRSVQTQFKPGQRSGAAARNYVPIGTERLSKDGYLERKVTDDHPVPARRWNGVHRIVWEAAHGPIPPGHAVVFRPHRRTSDAALIVPDALELVTRAELMRRNSYLTRYPKDVADVIRLRGALNRKINNRSKKREEQNQ